MGNSAFIKVDLSQPRALLEMRFKQYLDDCDTAMPDRQELKKSINKIRAHHLLAYLDLSLWASQNGCKIEDKVMMLVLEFDGNPDKIRKVVKKNAKALLNADGLREVYNIISSSDD